MTDPQQAASHRIIQEASEIAHKAAIKVANAAKAEGVDNPYVDGISRMILLSAGAVLLSIGLGGREGEHFVIQNADRAEAVNSCFAANKIRYRLVEVQ
jgi:hypothetical protein